MKSNAAVAREIVNYIAATKKTTQSYSVGERQAISEFLAELEKSDLRQAELVTAGYKLCGGKDDAMACVAARSIQMVHTYALMIAAQKSTVAALSGLHAAQIVLANLSAPQDVRLKAVSITNRSLLLFMHAQAAEDKQGDQVQHCLATENALNPLHVGMVLAGADCAATDEVTAFALALGHFWITNSDQYKRRALNELDHITLWPATDLQHLRTLL